MVRAARMLVSGLLALSVFIGIAHADGEAMVLPTDPSPLVIKTAKQDIRFAIEVADDSTERARGLMFRDRLPEGRGMFFVFTDDDVQGFWMHNTPQPLDIIYIESDGEVESIHQAKPLDDTPIPSGGPVRFVLEIAAGEAKRLGIVPGVRASHPLIEAAAATKTP